MTRKNKFCRLICILCISMGCQAAHAEYPQNCIFLISGVCFDCDTPYILELGTKENCVKHCPQRKYIEGKYFNTCEIKNNKDGHLYPFHSAKYQVPPENCQTEGYFYDIYNEECYRCDTIMPVWVKPDCEKNDECLHRCDNREIQYTDATTAISVLKCPPERPLMDRFFACWGCDEPTPIDVKFNQERILGAKYNRQSVVCQGQRYFKDEGTLSYPCPQNKEKLSEKACTQCRGTWQNGGCY